MYQIHLCTQLHLRNPGQIELFNILVSELSSNNAGCALFINSTQVFVNVQHSIFQKCVSSAYDYGGSISVWRGNEVSLSHVCFSQNYCTASPDIILYGTLGNDIFNSNINQTSFLKSSTSESKDKSCSNWFRALSLTLHTLNISSMEAKVRASGICFGSVTTIAPITKYVLIDNCTTANYIIEIYSYKSLLQNADCFAIINSSAKIAALSCPENRYSINFRNCMFSKIDTNNWKETDALTVEFESSFFESCPSREGYTSKGEGIEWEYDWPDLLQCLKGWSISGNAGLEVIDSMRKIKLAVVLTSLVFLQRQNSHLYPKLHATPCTMDCGNKS